MLRSLPAWKVSLSILFLSGSAFLAPAAFAQGATVAPAAVTPADIAPEVSAPDYTQMQLFMGRASSNERGRPSLAYKALRKNPPNFFDDYEAYLSGIDVASLGADDQLAYWLNLQNFLVVKAASTESSKSNLKSFRGTNSKPGKSWAKDRITIAGETYSIADIENKIVTEFDDPNVMYGIYQGVKGGPCLSNKPYEGATVNERLAELAKQYVNSNGIVVPQKKVADITPIYEWYKPHLFQDDDKLLLAHLRSNATTRLRGRLNTVRELDYSKLNYGADIFDPVKAAEANKPPRPKQQQRPPSTAIPSGGSGGGGGSYGS